MRVKQPHKEVGLGSAFAHLGVVIAVFLVVPRGRTAMLTARLDVLADRIKTRIGSFKSRKTQGATPFL